MEKRKLSSKKALVTDVTRVVMTRSSGIALVSPNADRKGLLIEAFGTAGYYAVSVYAGLIHIHRTGQHPWKQQ